MTEKRTSPNSGKKPHQKYKSFVVLQYLLKNSDEDHVVSAKAIVEDLQEEYGIDTERRSVYEDIKEINRVLLMLDQGCTIERATKALEKDTSDKLKTIVYDEHRKGFYVRRCSVNFYDLRLMAECIYASKFINEGHAKRLVNTICSFGSDYYGDQIRHDAFLVDRVKTNSKTVLRNISIIRSAMSTTQNGAAHTQRKSVSNTFSTASTTSKMKLSAVRANRISSIRSA